LPPAANRRRRSEQDLSRNLNRPKRPHKLLGFSAFKRAKTPRSGALEERELYSPALPRQAADGVFFLSFENGETTGNSRPSQPAAPGGSGRGRR